MSAEDLATGELDVVLNDGLEVAPSQSLVVLFVERAQGLAVADHRFGL